MAKEFEVVKPLVVSKEMEQNFKELGQSVREQFFEHRDREIAQVLKEYNLTFETAYKNGFVFQILKTPEGDQLIVAKIKDRRKLTSIEDFISAMVDNSTMKEM